MNQYFSKRTFTFKSFIKHFSLALRDMTNALKDKNSNLISKKFQEHIMLAVTNVNGCIICNWFHCKIALESGCTDEEINNILDFDFSSLNKEEAVALTFAQHYAETGGHPSKEAAQKLIKYYGLEKSKQILLFIRMITIGNLFGNTIEAFESRSKGKPPEKGNFLFEIILFLIGAPLYYSVLKNKI